MFECMIAFQSATFNHMRFTPVPRLLLETSTNMGSYYNRGNMIACHYPSKYISCVHADSSMPSSDCCISRESKKQKQVPRDFLDAYRHTGCKGMYHVTFTAVMHVIHLDLQAKSPPSTSLPNLTVLHAETIQNKACFGPNCR